MISFDFSYDRPATLEEARTCYAQRTLANKTALYYGGGTEIISMARAESIRFDGVIDIKGIPQCRALTWADNSLVIGSAVTLTEIAESGYFPLLGETVARIADHTIQGKITLGGNLGGTIIYREAALPLMITNCQAKVMTKEGLLELPFSQIFDGRLQLKPEEFLVQVLIDENDVHLPYNHVKKTKLEKITYPLISLTANKKAGYIRAAISGAGSMPLLLSSDLLNDAALPEDKRIAKVMEEISGHLISDIHGSNEYRRFVLGNILAQMYENLQGA